VLFFVTLSEMIKTPRQEIVFFGGGGGGIGWIFL